MEQGPPDHPRLRRFVNRAFARSLTEIYANRVQAIAARVRDEALVRDEFDCVEATLVAPRTESLRRPDPLNCQSPWMR